MSNITLPSTSALMTPGKLVALVNIDRDIIHQLVAQTAGRLSHSQHPLTLIDCACSFNATRVLELIHLEQIDFKQAMDRILVSRPFTAYQLKASTSNLLKQQSPNPTKLGPSWSEATAIIFMSPLSLLYDDNLQLNEPMRLLNALLSDWAVLRRQAPIILTVAPPPADMQARLPLFQKLLATADQIITPELLPSPQSEQPSLFTNQPKNSAP